MRSIPGVTFSKWKTVNLLGGKQTIYNDKFLGKVTRRND